MWKDILLVGTGSAIGGISRFVLGKLISSTFIASFPYSTFLINIVGSFLIGVFIALQGKQSITEMSMLFLTVGFCGGFTTFSSFSLENILLLKQGNVGIAMLYIASSIILGLAAVYLGMIVIGD